MRILWHSNAPGGGGYGGQTAHAVRALRDLGHDVTISAFNMGGSGVRLTGEWEGFPVLPGGHIVYGNSVIAGHARTVKADLVMTLVDIWTLNPAVFEGLNVAPWVPVDTEPLSGLDNYWLQQAGEAAREVIPIAMSQHGHRMLSAACHAAEYVPHCVDTRAFTPPANRARLRQQQGIPDGAFIVAMVQENKGPRKAIPRQLEGFAKFRVKHPNAYLRLHTDPRELADTALDLEAVVHSLGIGKAVEFPDPYTIETGGYGLSHIVSLLQTADVLLQCTSGEGFGIPVIEAMACGTPVIATRCSALTELITPACGWLVSGTREWVNRHRSYWTLPDPDGIARALERAYVGAARMRRAARAQAEKYSTDVVAREHWKPVIEEIERRIA